MFLSLQPLRCEHAYSCVEVFVRIIELSFIYSSAGPFKTDGAVLANLTFPAVSGFKVRSLTCKKRICLPLNTCHSVLYEDVQVDPISFTYLK